MSAQITLFRKAKVEKVVGQELSVDPAGKAEGGISADGVVPPKSPVNFSVISTKPEVTLRNTHENTSNLIGVKKT